MVSTGVLALNLFFSTISLIMSYTYTGKGSENKSEGSEHDLNSSNNPSSLVKMGLELMRVYIQSLLSLGMLDYGIRSQLTLRVYTHSSICSRSLSLSLSEDTWCIYTHMYE